MLPLSGLKRRLTMGNELMLILANLGACLFGIYICLCRMAKMSASETKPIIRAQYTVWVMVFSASGISWIYGYPATPIQILMAAGILAFFALSVGAWRFGAPPHTWRHN